MKKKSRKQASTVNKSRSTKYSLRNRGVNPNPKDKKNIEKLFDEMKKDFINEIKKIAENTINEHKVKIIKTINDNQINETISIQKEKEEKKSIKVQKSTKKGKANSLNKTFTKEKKGRKKSISPIKKINTKKTKNNSIKSKNGKKRTKNTKNNKKKMSKNESLVSVVGDKIETSSLNELSKLNVTVPKINKIEKTANEKSVNDNSLIGKKRNRRNDNNFVLYLNSEPNCMNNTEEINQNQKKINNKRSSKSTRKIKNDQ